MSDDDPRNGVGDFDSKGRLEDLTRHRAEAQAVGEVEPFWNAVVANDLQRNREFLASWPVLALDGEALFEAVRHGHEEVVAMLFEAGGSADGCDLRRAIRPDVRFLNQTSAPRTPV
jgi:hypothetical protein